MITVLEGYYLLYWLSLYFNFLIIFVALQIIFVHFAISPPLPCKGNIVISLVSRLLYSILTYTQFLQTFPIATKHREEFQISWFSTILGVHTFTSREPCTGSCTTSTWETAPSRQMHVAFKMHKTVSNCIYRHQSRLGRGI